MKKQQQRIKITDPLIVPRVKNYLAENVDKTFVDVGQMARSLKERYREYSNRNESAFCQMVEAAYKVVLQSYGLDGASTSEGSEEESDDLELLEDGGRALNDQLLAMYKLQDKKRAAPRRERSDKSGEPIDIISSDEDAHATAKIPKINDQITITPHVSNKMPEKSHTYTNNLRMNPKQSEKKKKFDMKVYTPKRKADQVNKMSKVTFEDIGGLSDILTQVCDLILHMKHPEVYKKLGIKSPRGALLHGPPGTGKTLLAHGIAGKLQLPMVNTAGTELVGSMSGESEQRIRELFERAVMSAPCVLFIDEIDAICGNRLNAQKDMERRIVAQLLASLDELGENDASVLVLAATNNPDSLDPALRRAGRLEQEIALGIPSLRARKEILPILCRGMALADDVDMSALAQITPGFVGADLQALVNKACTFAIKRVFMHIKENNSKKPEIEIEVENSTEQPDVIPNGDKEPEEKEQSKEEVEETAESIEKPLETVAVEETKTTDTAVIQEETLPEPPKPSDPVAEVLSLLEYTKAYKDEQLADMKICQEDFLKALKTTKPCAVREGIVTVPDVTWADVGSLNAVREELQLAVLAPVKYPDQLQRLGLSSPSGVLLCGPPGCGKTLLAKAVANEAGVNFISVKGPELLNMYVGESERAVRTCFRRAKNSAPCVIFFDEFDALCPKRQQNDNGGATRVVNQLLTEMDGIESREGVFILAASNRPDIIDPAVLRPGRLDRVMYVGMPRQDDRIDILEKITKHGTVPPLSSDVSLNTIAELTQGYTGADLAGVVRSAATNALTQHIADGTMEGEITVHFEHFREALAKCKPSVSQKEQQHYEKLRQKYASGPEDMEMDAEAINEESMDTV